MKTYNGLFDKIVSKENVERAIERAAKHKRHRRDVQRCLKNKEQIAEHLSNQLRNGDWRPIKIHNAVEINDGVNLKKRIIVCPNFEQEQVVHHAIMIHCAPLFISKFYYYSCGSVPEKGREMLIRYLRKEIKNKRKTKYYCQLDIRKFFASVNPLVAFRALRWLIKDRRVLGLFAKILRSNYIRDIDGSIKRTGLPIGFYTSPWIGNLVLSKIDHMVKEQLGVNVYARYIDDMVLFHSNRRQLQRAVKCIVAELRKLGLDIKKEPSIHLLDKRKLTFLGVVISRERVVLTSKIFLRYKRMAKRIGKKDNMTVYDAMRVISIMGGFQNADCEKAFLEYIYPYVSVNMSKLMISRKDRLKHERKFKLANCTS